jgi:acetyl esterase/lipase
MCRGAAKKGNPTSFSPFDPIDDLRAAVLWVRTHGGQYGADTSRLAAMGASAGGHASLLLGTAPGAGRPNLVASWSPPNNSLPKGYVGCAKSACRSTWEALTPADQASSGDAPTFLGHAVFDRQTAATQSVAIARALRRANVPVEMKLYATNAHGADLLPCAIDDTMIFLRARFGMPPDASLVALSAAECAAATTSVVQRTNA